MESVFEIYFPSYNRFLPPSNTEFVLHEHSVEFHLNFSVKPPRHFRNDLWFKIMSVTYRSKGPSGTISYGKALLQAETATYTIQQQPKAAM